MNPESLRALCARCGTEELLSAIAAGNGSCSSCHLSYCDDTVQLRVDAYRAVVAYRQLIRSLRNLSASSLSIAIPSEPLLGGPAAVAAREGRHV